MKKIINNNAKLSSFLKPILKIFTLILLVFLSNKTNAQANVDVAFSNSTSFTWHIDIVDASSNVLYSVNPTPNSTGFVQCLRMATTPTRIVFSQGGCSFSVAFNTTSLSCGAPCSVCPAFTGTLFTNTYSAGAGGGCTLPIGPSDLLSISF
jgi:hypothetical protein